jgi:hypothetical protein
MSGLRFGVETDERYTSLAGGLGELVRSEDNLDDTISQVAGEIGSALRHANVDSARVEFGLEFNEEGAIFVTRGRETSHIVLTLEFTRDVEH